MRFVLPALSFVLALASFSSAQARVFNISQEKFAAYIRGTYFPGAIENTAFSESNGANLTVDDEFKYNFSGEFGFVYSTEVMNLRFGFELIRPPKIEGTASDGSAVAMYDFKSDASVFAPKVGLEFNLKKWHQTRLFLNLGAGAANLVGRNAYSFTTDGTAAYAVADYSEDLRGTALLYEASLGFETLMADTTTFSLEAGYRMLNFDKIKHNKDVTTLNSTAVTKGDTAMNLDGTDRKLDLSGAYIGVNFRFWLF